MDDSKIEQRQKILGQLTIEPPLSNEERMFLEGFIKHSHFEDRDNLEGDIYDAATFMQPKKLSSEELNDLFRTVLSNIHERKIFPSVSCPLSLVNPCNKGVIALSINSKHREKETSAVWVAFLIEHFFKPNSIAKIINPEKFSFLKDHTVTGTIWFKTEKAWEAQKITVEDNIVKQYLADTPVILPTENEKLITVGVNKNNYQTLRFGPNSWGNPKYRNNSMEKQYHSLNITDIAEYNRVAEPIIATIPKSKFLDQLILVGTLKSNLHTNNVKTKKIKL